MIGKVFFARVASATTPFDPEAHAVEELTIFSASVSQGRQEAAIVTIECEYPEGGLFGGPRWGMLSAEIDGTVMLLARGEIVVFPMALAGQTVRIEMICRRSDHTAAVDALFASRNPEVPSELVDIEVERRTEGWILDEVYHDPQTLTPSLQPIAGNEAPLNIVFGEGSESGTSNVLSIRAEITDAPPSFAELELEAYLEQRRYAVFNAAGRFGAVEGALRRTLTPNALRDAITSASTDGGYEILSGNLETSLHQTHEVYISEKVVDPTSCVITQKAGKAEVDEYSIDSLEIDTLVQAVQPRREYLKVRVTPELQALGGESDITETLYMSDADARAQSIQVLSYNPGNGVGVRQFSKRGVSASLFSSGGAFRESCSDIVAALATRAARQLIEAAHCVELTIATTAETAMSVTLKDRVRINDVRLPAGYAIGKVVGIDYTLSETDSGQIMLACPISADATGRNEVELVMPAPDIDITSPIVTTATMAALISGDPYTMTTSFALSDTAEDQLTPISGTTEEIVIEDPESRIPKTGIEIEFRDLQPMDADDVEPTRMAYAPITLRLPEGIQL